MAFVISGYDVTISCNFDSLIGWLLFPPILTLTESSCDINQVDFLLYYMGGHPHGNASVCKRTCFGLFWPVVHMDLVNAVPVNTLFLKPGLRVEKSENAALVFSCGRRICILCASMTPSPQPSTSGHRPLNPATSHNNNNNNGGLNACVHAAEDIEPIRVSRAKYYAPLPLHWAKKDYGQPF